MTWLQSVPINQLPYMTPADTRSLDAAVCHRTIGNWGGDYSVLSRGRVPSVHVLVGKEYGQWVQFYPYERKCNHAAGANLWSYGIEVSGGNGEPFTPWQVAAVRHIVAELVRLGVSLNHKPNNGNRVSHWNGFLDHASVDGGNQNHSDAWNLDDWNRVASTAPPSAPDPPPVDLQAIARVYAASQEEPSMPKQIKFDNHSHVYSVTPDGRLRQNFYNGTAWFVDWPAEQAGATGTRFDPKQTLDVKTASPLGQSENPIDIYALSDKGELVHVWYGNKGWVTHVK